MEQMMQMLSLARRKLDEAQPGTLEGMVGACDSSAVSELTVTGGAMTSRQQGEGRQQQVPRQLGAVPEEVKQWQQDGSRSPPETTPTSDKVNMTGIGVVT
jgi:hypothetical protein